MNSPTQTDRPINIKIIKMARRVGYPIRAMVDIQLGSSLKLLGCKVIQQEGQKAWVAMPSREWVDDRGQKKYAATVELLGNLKTAIEKAILAEWEGDER